MTEPQVSERSIFQSAIDKASPQERAAHLDLACGDNLELRGEVEALLAAHDRLGSDASAVPGVTLDQLPASERSGAVIGPYKLLQKIGEGGMGTVFMAEQTHPVRRRVALKLIKAGMDSRQVIARFESERQALAMMDHVNIARALDAGTTQSGLPYFVMELVHGVPISKYCDDNQLTPRQRLELFIPVCRAIQHAHQKGIIHRDIKPSNVMITLYDGKPVPKVIDFGVAKATEQKLTERTLFTQYGTMVGTLEHMSPEQAEMSGLGIDTRSDIYSLGVLLYELLTGSTPLSQKRVREIAEAWGNRGAAYMDLSQPEKAVADLDKAIQLNPKLAPAWSNRGATYAILGQTDKAMSDLCKAIELDPKLTDAWLNRGGIYLRQGDLEKAIADFTKAIDVDPEFAAAWNSRALAYESLGQVDKAIAGYSKAIELDPKCLAAWNNRGDLQFDLCQSDKAVADFSRALELDATSVDRWFKRGMAYAQQGQTGKAIADFSKVIETDSKIAEVWCNRGGAYAGLKQWDKALDDLSIAIQLDPKQSEAWNNRGTAYANLDQWDKAAADFTKAIELAPKYGDAMRNLATLLIMFPDVTRRDPARAVKLLRKALELNPNDVASFQALGWALCSTGAWKDSIESFQKSMALQETPKGGDSGQWYGLAIDYWQTGNKVEARKWYDQAVQWMEKNAPTDESLLRYRGQAEEVLKTDSASVLSDNTASTGSGGGIFNSGTLGISNHSALTDNSTTYFGRGIANFGIATVTDASLSANIGGEGGGIANWDIFGFGILTVRDTQLSQNTSSNCTLDQNVAANEGGGIYTIIGGNFDVSDCTLLHNSATSGSGGGIFDTSIMTVSASRLSDNSAGFAGGGIFNFATLTVSDSIFTGNAAASNGGGIYTSNDLGGFVTGITTINGSTFSTNTPDNIFGNDYFGGGNTFA